MRKRKGTALLALLLVLSHCSGHGGVKQFLNFLFPNAQRREEFGRPDVQYARMLADIPCCMEGDEDKVLLAYVHMSQFNFGVDAGLTGMVELSKSEVLLNLFVAHNFTTGEEPIRVRWPSAAPLPTFAWEGCLRMFWVSSLAPYALAGA